MNQDQQFCLLIAEPLVEHFEKCVLFEYKDARGFPTIGWGHRIIHLQYPHGITQAQADQFFDNDINWFYRGVTGLIHTRVTSLPCEVAAMVSMAYNVGLAAFAGSTLLRLYNEGDKLGAATEFTKWDHAGFVVLEGLLERRECEEYLYNGGSLKQLIAMNWKVAA